MIFTMAFATAGVASVAAPAGAGTNVNTDLTRGVGGGSAPIVKAKWEMKGPAFTNTDPTDYVGWTGGEGKDDSTDAGAQFNPPGIWNDVMNYTVCAIVTDPNGVDDIDGVYADIYYPEGIAFHPVDLTNADNVNGGPAGGVNVPSLPDNHQGSSTSPEYDYGESGCGSFIEENTLLKLTKDEGLALFCDEIQTNNTNLPEFFGTYSYSEICGATGELEKETAYVYCDDKTLTWEDPAGNYRVDLFAQDTAGNFSYTGAPDFNYFTYVPLTAFEVDFSSVSYGEVLLNVHKRVSGDLSFGTSDKPTVRNTGNTRLYMGIQQSDMGLGMTSGGWNVEYDARIGNEELDWRYFSPDEAEPQLLEDILDLSEEEEMDFSILISKYPTTATSFVGDMILSAEMAEFRHCE